MNELDVDGLVGQLGQAAARHPLYALPAHVEQLHEHRYALELAYDDAVVEVARQLMQRAHCALDDLLHVHVVDDRAVHAALLRLLMGRDGLDEQLHEARYDAEIAQCCQIAVGQCQVSYKAYMSRIDTFEFKIFLILNLLKFYNL